MKTSRRNNGTVLVIMELLFLLFVITLLRNTFVKDSVALTTVAAVWISSRWQVTCPASSSLPPARTSV